LVERNKGNFGLSDQNSSPAKPLCGVLTRTPAAPHVGEHVRAERAERPRRDRSGFDGDGLLGAAASVDLVGDVLGVRNERVEVAVIGRLAP
jgi:hypothetical protein